MSKPLIEFPEFQSISERLEIKSGQVIEAESVPKSKLIKLTVDFCEEGDKFRTVLTNLSSHFKPEDFLFKNFMFVTNLHPMTQKGIVSQAMILPGTTTEGDINLTYFNGSKIL